MAIRAKKLQVRITDAVQANKGITVHPAGFVELCRASAPDRVYRHPIPDNVKWFIRPTPKNYIMVAEYKPQLRTISAIWQSRYSNKPRMYACAFPYVIIVLDSQHCYAKQRPLYVFYRNKPLTCLDDWLYNSNLENVYWYANEKVLADTISTKKYSNICIGLHYTYRLNRATAPQMPPQIALDTAYEGVFCTTFNSEFSTAAGFQRYSFDPAFASVTNYVNWQKASLRNPDFVLRLKWHKCCTVRSLLTALLTDDYHSYSAGLDLDVAPPGIPACKLQQRLCSTLKRLAK